MNRLEDSASTSSLTNAARSATSSGFVWAAAAVFAVGSTGCGGTEHELSGKRPEDLELAERAQGATRPIVKTQPKSP